MQVSPQEEMVLVEPRFAISTRTKRRTLIAVVTVPVAVALTFPAWRPVVAIALILLAANFLPWLVVRVVEWFENRQSTRRRRNGQEHHLSDRRIADDRERVSGGRGSGTQQRRKSDPRPCG